MNPVRALEKIASLSANALWPVMQQVGRLGPEPEPFHPAWSDAPIPRGKDRERPPLGWPRETDSLCPTCVKEARAEILRGDASFARLLTDKPGEIRARIVERDGKVVMEKTCPEHGRFDDVIAEDPRFLSRIERLFGGRDVRMTP